MRTLIFAVLAVLLVPGDSSAQQRARVNEAEAHLHAGNALYLAYDMAGARREWQLATDAGNIDAKVSLGILMVGNNRGVFSDIPDRTKVGADLLREAAAAGRSDAMHVLANCCFSDPSEERSMWLSRAATAGSAAAQLQLADEIFDEWDRRTSAGRPVGTPPAGPFPPPEGMRWLKRAAAQGDLQAQAMLGNTHLKISCYVAHGSWSLEDCMAEVGKRLANGTLTKDDVEGLCWLRHVAASKGIVQPEATKIRCRAMRPASR